MRIGVLSRKTGLPVGTVKFYLRSGLLHPGRSTSVTQALYNDTHVERLLFVRAMLRVGRLSLAQIQEVLTAMASPAVSSARALRSAAARPDEPELSEGTDENLDSAVELLEALGWQAIRDDTDLSSLAAAIGAFEAVDMPLDSTAIKPYAAAAQLAAEQDVTTIAAATDEERVKTAVITTHLGDALMAALRDLARQHEAESLTSG